MMYRARWLVLAFALFGATRTSGDEKPLCFPPVAGPWQCIEPGQVGWNAGKLNEVPALAGQRKSSGVATLRVYAFLLECGLWLGARV